MPKVKTSEQQDPKYSVSRQGRDVLVVVESSYRPLLIENEVLHQAIRKAEEAGFADYAISDSKIIAFYEDGEPVVGPQPGKKIIYQRHIVLSPKSL